MGVFATLDAWECMMEFWGGCALQYNSHGQRWMEMGGTVTIHRMMIMRQTRRRWY